MKVNLDMQLFTTDQQQSSADLWGDRALESKIKEAITASQLLLCNTFLPGHKLLHETEKICQLNVPLATKLASLFPATYSVIITIRYDSSGLMIHSFSPMSQ